MKNNHYFTVDTSKLEDSLARLWLHYAALNATGLPPIKAMPVAMGVIGLGAMIPPRLARAATDEAEKAMRVAILGADRDRFIGLQNEAYALRGTEFRQPDDTTYVKPVKSFKTLKPMDQLEQSRSSKKGFR